MQRPRAPHVPPAPCGSWKQAGGISAPAPADFRNLLRLAMAISRMRTGLQQARLPACAGCSIIVDGCIYRQISSASIIPMSPTPTLYAAFSPASYTEHTIRYDTVQHHTMSIQYDTIQYSQHTIQRSTASYTEHAQYDTIQYSQHTIQRSTASYNEHTI